MVGFGARCIRHGAELRDSLMPGWGGQGLNWNGLMVSFCEKEQNWELVRRIKGRTGMVWLKECLTVGFSARCKWYGKNWKMVFVPGVDDKEQNLVGLMFCMMGSFLRHVWMVRGWLSVYGFPLDDQGKNWGCLILDTWPGFNGSFLWLLWVVSGRTNM